MSRERRSRPNRARSRVPNAAPRLVVATDVWLEQAEGEYRSTHPSISAETLSRYTDTGWQVRLVARTKRGSVSERSVVSDGELEIFPLWGDSKSRPFALRVPALARQIWGIPLQGTDLVVVRLPELVSTLLWIRARQVGAPTIANVVADASAMARSAGSLRPLMKRLAVAFVRWMVKRSEAVLYVTREWLQGEYPARPGAPTLSASNARLSQDFRSPEPKRYDQEALRACARLIAVGHHIGYGKGHDTLIRALPMLIESGWNVHLDLVGDGPQSDDLRTLADALQVADRVTFRGMVSDREVLVRLLDESDLFIMPSRAEGLPRAMVEAMARGLCCLGSSVGGIPELAPPLALFEPNDPGDIARCVKGLLDNAEEATRIAASQWVTASTIASEAQPERVTAFLEEVHQALA